MICKYCGNVVDADAEVCPYCGSTLTGYNAPAGYDGGDDAYDQSTPAYDDAANENYYEDDGQSYAQPQKKKGLFGRR